MASPTDLASMVAEIKNLIFVNGVGAITAKTLQQVLLDTLNVLDTIAAQTAAEAAQQVVNFSIDDVVAEELLSYPTTMPTTPGTLWWDNGVLARTDGDPPAPAVGVSTTAFGAAIDARLLGYGTTLPATPGQLWWDGGLLVRS